MTTIMNNRREKLEAIFEAAAALETDAQRCDYLDRACPEADLRQEVMSLLEAMKQPDSLFADGDTRSLLQSTPVLEQPGTVIGHYKLLQKVGEGGMGVVYMAQQTEPVSRKVALKIIKPGMDTRQVIARFEAERQALAMMDHPGIAKVFDAGATASGRPYFVMELVRGVPITEYCDRNKLPTRQRLELFIPVCQAIQHAHQKGVIHRDIKPSNVMVTLHDGNPVPKIIDFGIAKATSQRLTEKTLFTNYAQMIGTPAYMSPEQAEMSGLDVDTRTDVYALGVLLYELLTGTTPFPTNELLSLGYGAMQRIIAEKEPPKPSTRVSTMAHDERTVVAKNRSLDASALGRLCRGDLDWIVMKALEKDRTHRYETVNGLAADLKRHLENEPIVARPPSAFYRFQKSWRRNRLAYSAGAAIAISLLAGLWISTSQTWRATAARNAEAQARQAAERARSMAEEEKQNALTHLRAARRTAYLADMHIVQEAIDNNNMGRARRILQEHQPRSTEEDFRDWEWFYFARLAWADDGEVMGKHPGGARQLVIGSADRFVTIGRPMHSLPSLGHIQIWDAARRAAVAGFAAPEDATAIAVSHDGKRLALACGHEIQIRDFADPAKLLTVLTNWAENLIPGSVIDQLCFVENDTRLALAGQGNTQGIPLTFIEVASDSAVPALRKDAITEVVSTAISTDGRRLAVNLAGNEVIILRLPGAEEVVRFRIPTEHAVSRGIAPMCYVDRDGALATASESGQIDLWDAANGSHIRSVGGHMSSVTSLAASPDGKWLVSSGLDQLIKVWDLGDAKATPRILRGHEDEVWGVGFVAGGRSLVSCSRDEAVRFWDLRRPTSSDGTWMLPSGQVIAIVRQGVLAAATREWRWATWDVSHIPESMEPQIVSLPTIERGACVIPLGGTDYRLVIPEPSTAEADPGFRVLLYRGLERPERVHEFPEISLLRSEGIGMSRETLFVHGLIRGASHLLVWSLADARVSQLIRTSIESPGAMAVSPDATLAVLGDQEGTLELLNVVSGKSDLWRNALASAVSALAILPDNRTLAAATYSGSLQKIDWPSRATLKADTGSLLSIEAMSLSPSGTRLATGDAQGVVRLWDAETLREVAELGRHPGRVGGVSFQPDGQTLLSVDPNELRVWRAGGNEP